MLERHRQYLLYAAICVLVFLLSFHWTNLQTNIAFHKATDEQKEKTLSNPLTKMEYKTQSTQSTSDSSRSSAVTKAVKNESSRGRVVSKKSQAGQIVRDSIETIHLSNFEKPKGETCEKRFPTAIIIGAGKSGTLELLEFLHLHPHIQIYYDPDRRSAQYEMLYFSSLYNKGVTWFKEQMPCSFSNQVTVMKMATYYRHLQVPERIKKFNESIKLILIVREPIARAYSGYTFHGGNRKNSKSFSDLVINKATHEVQENDKRLRESVYANYMEHWLKYFSLSQFLILSHGEFVHDPVTTLKKVERFLGLGDYITADMFAFNSEKGFYCIKSNLTTTGMGCYGDNRGRPQEPIDQETRLKLTQFFAERNRRFFNIIGKSYNW